MTDEPVATCFISYSHADKSYATDIADGLKMRGYRVWIDGGELRIGDSLIETISSAIDQVDFLIALVSRASVESNWCQREVALAMTGEVNRQGITVLPCRMGDAPMPATLKDKLYLSLDSGSAAHAVDTLDQDMRKHLAPRQPLPPRRRAPQGAVIHGAPRGAGIAPIERFVPSEPVRMTGIDTNSMTSPRNDGTRGSALYMVPITLNVAPDRRWIDLFVQHWDRPPQFTTMHRPGIASVVGASIHLNGTTVEEVEKHHAATLKLAVNAANRDRAAIADAEQRQRQQEAHEAAQRRQAAEEAAARIAFE